MNENRRPKADQFGFTLIEVLISVALLSIGVLSVAALQVSAMKGRADSYSTTTASAWAGEQAEQLMSLDYTDTDLSAGDHSATLGNDGKYQANWTVAVDSTGNTKTIALAVAWERDGRNHSTKIRFKRARDLE